jgi:ribosomal protein L7/L12
MSGPAALDLAPLASELEAFASRRFEPGRHVTGTVLREARALLERAREAAAAKGLAAAAEAAAGAGAAHWEGMRLGAAASDLEVFCWRQPPGALLAGRWERGALLALEVRLGEQVWAAHQTPHGESRWSSDGLASGPADKRRFTDLLARMREELRRWREATQLARWICPRCSWENEEGSASCAVCGSAAGGGRDARTHWARDVGAGGAGETAAPGAPTATAVPGGELPLPPGLDAWLAELADAQATAPHSLAATDPNTRFDIVLHGYDRARKVALVRAIVDARHSARQSPGGPAVAHDLLARLPAVVAQGLKASTAERVRRWLEAAGGTLEIRTAR